MMFLDNFDEFIIICDKFTYFNDKGMQMLHSTYMSHAPNSIVILSYLSFT